MISISPQQAKEVRKLVKKQCANYDLPDRKKGDRKKGDRKKHACLLLDNGEKHVCVQDVSEYGIYCRYFREAVLPLDKKLYDEIMNPLAGKRCVLCRGMFTPRAKNQRYCPECAIKQKRRKGAERLRRYRKRG